MIFEIFAVHIHLHMHTVFKQPSHLSLALCLSKKEASGTNMKYSLKGFFNKKKKKKNSLFIL